MLLKNFLGIILDGEWRNPSTEKSWSSGALTRRHPRPQIVEYGERRVGSFHKEIVFSVCQSSDRRKYTFPKKREIRKGLLASCSGFYWIFMGEKEPGTNGRRRRASISSSSFFFSLRLLSSPCKNTTKNCCKTTFFHLFDSVFKKLLPPPLSLALHTLLENKLGSSFLV